MGWHTLGRLTGAVALVLLTACAFTGERTPDPLPAAAMPLADTTVVHVSGTAAGQWVQDPRTGCLVRGGPLDPGETLRWTGPCPDGKADGRGILQMFSDGAPGHRYEGGWKNGHRHGHGVMMWSNGNRYQGNFKDDRFDGRGIAIWANGDWYDGGWRDGRLHGRGAMIWADGNRYQGTWSDGFRDGTGTHVRANGSADRQVWRIGQRIR
jgi:hypothetical protein